MISQKSSTKKGKNFSLSGAGSFLRCKIKTSWASFLLYGCLSLIIPVIMLIVLGSASRTDRGMELLNLMCTDDFQLCFYIASAVAALISSVFTWKNMHTKQGNYFEHKLPITRNAIFASNTLFGILLFAAPFILMMLIFVVIGATSGCGTGIFLDMLAQIVRLTVYTLAFYIFHFSLFSLFSAVCGNTAVHIAFSAVAIFIPYVASLCLDEQFKLITGWNLESSFIYNLLKISPISVYESFGLLTVMSAGAILGKILILLAVSAVIFVCGMFLAMFAKSERAGEAFTYNGVKVAIKYIIIYLAMSLVAIVIAMSDLNKNFALIAISALLVILVGFVANIILNMVMYRGARHGAIKGIKAFSCVAVASVAILTAMIMRSAEPAKFLPGVCKNVIISTGDSSEIYILTEKDDINGIMDIVTGRGELTYISDDIYATDGCLKNPFSATIIVNTTTGAKLLYNLRTYLTPAGSSFIRNIKTEANMNEALRYLSEKEEVVIYGLGGLQPYRDNGFRNSELARIFRDVYVPEFNERQRSGAKEVPAYSCFSIQISQYQYRRFTIYSDMTKTISAIKKLYEGKSFPDVPAFSAEDILADAEAADFMKMSVDVEIYGVESDDVQFITNYYNCFERNYSSSSVKDRETITRLLDIYMSDSYGKNINYETPIFSDGEMHDIYDDDATLIAYATVYADIRWSNRGIGVRLEFNRELAGILGINYDAVVHDINNCIVKRTPTYPKDNLLKSN